MLQLLKHVRPDATCPLTNVIAADRFWRVLQQYDPVAAQQAISEALTDFVVRDGPDRDQVRALLLFDQRAQPLSVALLVNYATLDV